MALDLERDREPLAEVEHAGVLARALQHARAALGAAASGEAPSACSRSAPTRGARRRRARSRSARARAASGFARAPRRSGRVRDGAPVPSRSPEPQASHAGADRHRLRRLRAGDRIPRLADSCSERTRKVASARALLLVAAAPAGVDVGRLVPVHQARGRGHPARRDDRSEALHGRGLALRLSRVSRRSHAGGRPAQGRVAPVPGARNHQRGNPDDARRLGRDPHRLEHRRDRAVVGSDLRRDPGAPIPPPRSARAAPDRRAGHRDHGCRTHHGRAPRRRRLGRCGNVRRRPLVPLVRERWDLRATPCPRNARRRSRHRLDDRRSAGPPSVCHGRLTDRPAGSDGALRTPGARPDSHVRSVSSFSSGYCGSSEAADCRW